ncbi:MAG TPA: CotH kinase family protein, partial [Candidatus Binatia bacterium]
TGKDTRRLYFPWDLDAVFRSTTGNIYASGSGRKVAPSTYQQVILGHPVFRAQYNQIMLDLLNGPLSVANVQSFLNQAEAVISEALTNDPFPTTDASPADEFAQLRAWVAARDVSVRSQVSANGPPSPRP